MSKYRVSLLSFFCAGFVNVSSRHKPHGFSSHQRKWWASLNQEIFYSFSRFEQALPSTSSLTMSHTINIFIFYRWQRFAEILQIWIWEIFLISSVFMRIHVQVYGMFCNVKISKISPGYIERRIEIQKREKIHGIDLTVD